MASTIKLKNGSGAPLASDLVAGEPALDLTNKRLYTEDSGGTVIEVGTNPTEIQIDNINIDGNTISSTDTNGNITLAPNGTGVVALSSTDLTFGDNDKATFGAGDDLQIYHDGSNSYIKDAGTGTLNLQSSDTIRLQTSDGAGGFQNVFAGVDEGAAFLYYDGSDKLQTTNTGIDVTGTVTADGLTVGSSTITESSNDLTINATDDLFLQSNSDLAIAVNANEGTGELDFVRLYKRTGEALQVACETGDISFYDSSASQAFYWDASAASLGIGTTSPSTTLDVVNTAASTTVARVNNASASSGAYAQFQVDSDAATAYFGVSGSGNTVNGGAYDSDFAYLFASNNASGLNIGTGSGGPLIKFYTGGSAAANERMRIDSSGNVGIGDTSPSDKLSLEVGSANEGVSIYYSGTEVGSFRNDAANATINANNASLKLETGGTERMRINSGGDVSFRDTSANEAFYWDASAASLGIGTDSPAYKLDIQDASTPIFRMMDTTNDCTLLMYPQNTSAIFGTYSAHPLLFYTDSAEAMRIDSSGNVSVTGEKFNLGGTGNNAVFNSNFSMHFNIDADNNGSEIFAWGHNGDNTSASRLMTLDASGNLLVGTDSFSTAGTDTGLLLSGQYGQLNANFHGNDYHVWNIHTSGTQNRYVQFRWGNATVGSISTNGSTTSYNTSSDYRLKENVVDMTGAVDRVKSLNPSQFNFIAEPDRTVDGFLAHEVADVVPEAVTGTKDAMQTEEYEVTPAVLDEDGNVVTEAVMGTREVPDYQGIDQSKLVPLLTGALQEAIARIETLEAQVATLQGN
jgi:hypothetical protein